MWMKRGMKKMILIIVLVVLNYGGGALPVAADSYTTHGSLSFSKTTSNGPLLSHDKTETKTKSESGRLPQTSEIGQRWWILGGSLIIVSGGVMWYRSKKEA